MARNPNTTLHFEVRFDDGEKLREKCRDTLGGWINMMKRLEAHTGERVRALHKCVGDGRHVAGGTLVEAWDLLPEGAEWVEGGRRFSVVEIVKVAPGLWVETGA